MKAAAVLLLALLASCANVPEAVPAAMDARAEIDANAHQAKDTIIEALLVALDDAWWQYIEAEHEAKLRAAAVDGALTIKQVLDLREQYATVQANADDKLGAFRIQLEAVEARVRQGLELDAKTRRVLDAMRDRAAAAEGLAGAAVGATRAAADATKARRAAKAERRRREAEEAAKAAEEEGGE